MGRYEKIAFFVLVSVALFSAWISARSVYMDNTNPAPDHGGTYREGIVGQPRLVNPVLASSSADTALVRLVYSGLYTYDENGKLIPDLAEGMPNVSDDQKEYTVKIKPDARFQNDRNVTADDIIFTISTIQDPAFKSPYRNDWLNTTVEKVSDTEVRFKNSSIAAPFAHNLTLPILPQRLWSNVGAENFQLSELNLKAVGSGPYKVKEITKLPSGDVQKMVFESFKDYAHGEPYLNRVIVSFYNTIEDTYVAYQGGEISGFSWAPFTQTSESNISPSGAELSLVPLPQYQGLFFNVSNSKFTDKAVRKALALAVPRQDVITTTFNGLAIPLHTPIMPGQLGWKDVNATGFDSALAQEQWATIKNKPTEITLVTNDSPKNAGAAEVIASEWGKLGIQVNVHTLPTKELTEKHIRTRDFDVLLFGQKAGADPDPFAFWHSSQSKDPGLNVSGFTNTEVDQLLTGARSTLIEETRKANYEKFLDIINEETPAVFLNQGVLAYAMKPEIKRPNTTILFDTPLRFVTISKWYIEEKRVWK